MNKQRSYRRLWMISSAIVAVASIVSLVFYTKKQAMEAVEPIGTAQPIQMESHSTNAQQREKRVQSERTVPSVKPAVNETFIKANFSDLYQLEALALYKKYIDSANQGNADAQYIVSKAILKCNAYIPLQKSEEIEKKARLMNGYKPGRGDMYRNAMLNIQDKCHPLINIIGISGVDDMVNLQADWLKKAVEQGHVFADLELNHTQKPIRSEEERQAIREEYLAKIKVAFEHANEESHFLWSTSRHITKFIHGYLTKNKQKGDDYKFNGTDTLAWEFVTCEASHQCDPLLKKQNLLDKGYNQNDINKTLAKVRDLNDAIYMQDWQALNLDEKE